MKHTLFLLVIFVQALLLNATASAASYKIYGGQKALFTKWITVSEQRDLTKLISLFYPKSKECKKVKQDHDYLSFFDVYFFNTKYSIKTVKVEPYKEPKNPAKYIVSYFEVMPSHELEVYSVYEALGSNGKASKYRGRINNMYMVKREGKWYFAASCETELGMKMRKAQNIVKK